MFIQRTFHKGYLVRMAEGSDVAINHQWHLRLPTHLPPEIGDACKLCVHQPFGALIKIGIRLMLATVSLICSGILRVGCKNHVLRHCLIGLGQRHP